jgi:alpha-tubulin suppressor-like RCC1 family protein
MRGRGASSGGEGSTATGRMVLGAVFAVLLGAAGIAVLAGSARGGVVSSSVARIPGNVWAWGQGGHGELGNGSAGNSDVPVAVSNLSGVVAVAAGTGRAGYTGYALRSDGTVWAWGLGAEGELGNGSTQQSSNVPVQVRGLTHVVAIAAGQYEGYALRSDGSVWAWGSGGSGELGNGKQTSTYASAVPVKVHNLAHVVAIAAAGATGYALRRNGTVWAWGYGYEGQFGNGRIGSSPLAVEVEMPVEKDKRTHVVAIAEGGRGTGYALRSDGTVFAWGRGDAGELGNGRDSNSDAPVRVRKLTRVRAIAAGNGTAYALRKDGTVWAWGDNGTGELGNGSTGSASDVPVEVHNLAGVVAIAGGNGTGYAVDSNKSVWGWGDGSLGALGTGACPTPASCVVDNAPVQVSSQLTGVVAIAGGGEMAYAIVAG